MSDLAKNSDLDDSLSMKNMKFELEIQSEEFKDLI